MTGGRRDDGGVVAEDGFDLALPPGVIAVRRGPGANCSSAGSAVDVLFYGSVIVGALAVALAAAFAPRPDPPRNDGGDDEHDVARDGSDRSPTSR